MPERLREAGGECRIATFARRVLVPIDFSETSHAALACAVSLVRRCDASLHLLHVLENTAGAEPLEWQLGTRGDLERAIERRAWEELRRRLSAEDHARLRLRLAVESGTPTIEILRYARANDVDLIAMGRDGRGGIKPVLMGSVAEGVMRDAPCAVLSVRHPDDRRVTHHAHSSRVVHVFSH